MRLANLCCSHKACEGEVERTAAARLREAREAVEQLQPVPTWQVIERLAYKSAKDDVLRILREAEGIEP